MSYLSSQSSSGGFSGTINTNQIAFGVGANEIGGSDDFVFNPATGDFEVLHSGNRYLFVKPSIGIAALGDRDNASYRNHVFVNFSEGLTCQYGYFSSTDGTTFFGGGLDDILFTGLYTGNTDHTITITISSTGSPDLVNISRDGDIIVENEPLVVGTNTAIDGLTFVAQADSGHDLGDSWQTTATVQTVAAELLDFPGQSFTFGVIALKNNINFSTSALGTGIATLRTDNFVAKNASGSRYLDLGVLGGSFGDLDAAGNRTRFSYNDSLQKFSFISGNQVLQQQYETPSDGDVVAFSPGTQILTIDPSGGLITLTIDFPANPVNSEVRSFNVTQVVSTLTLSGGTFVGALTSITAGGGGATYIYSSGDGKWHFQP